VLFYPAIALDDADIFDAVSRVYSYAIGKPAQLLWWIVVAILVGTIARLLLAALLFAAATLMLTFMQLADFSRQPVGPIEATIAPVKWPLPSPLTMLHQLDLAHQPLASTIATLWAFAILCLVGGYCISYFGVAQAWIYLLIRRSCDGVGFSDFAPTTRHGQAIVAAPESASAK